MELVVFNNKEETKKEILTYLETLFHEYEESIEKMLKLSDATSELGDVVGYFLEGSSLNFSYSKIFDFEKAKGVLNAKMWSKVIEMTNVLKYMPAEDKNKWMKDIHDRNTPDFERLTVIDTIQNLLGSQDLFFAKKVDGIFRNLSGSHLTNSPSGFNKRMILENVITSYDTINYDKAHFIDDLRFVISKLIGVHNESPRSSDDLSNIKRFNLFGKWLPVDGGIFQMKLFKKGTVHIEIYPHLAIKLNQVLSLLYPSAIPSEHRSVSQKIKEFKLEKDFLSDAVVKCLQEINSRLRDTNSCQYYFSSLNKETKLKVNEVLQLLDATIVDNYISFSYDPKNILSEIILNRQIPERQSHQFYPTEESLSSMAKDMLGIIERWDSVLEPSAGNGRLLNNFHYKDKITCIDISKTQCDILKEKGFKNVLNLDFMKYPESNKFDKIIMNPPFTDNQAKNHLLKAVKHLTKEGILVAIVPSSLKDKIKLNNNYSLFISDVIQDAFLESNTKVNVCLLKIVKIE